LGTPKKRSGRPGMNGRRRLKTERLSADVPVVRPAIHAIERVSPPFVASIAKRRFGIQNRGSGTWINPAISPRSNRSLIVAVDVNLQIPLRVVVDVHGTTT